MANYAAAKMRLFDMESIQYAVVNANDAFGSDVISKLKANVNLLTYGCTETQTNIRAEKITYKADGVSFDAHVNGNKWPVSLPVLGEFNVDNILAAIGVLTLLGIDQQQCGEAINQCQPVSGRMQTYTQAGQPTVVIDYAHTPDALHQALKTLQVHLPKTGQLWCVFGCGGDRDRGKRPLMGKVAEREANQVIVTDDNPRTEDHLLIIEDILAGCDEPQKIRVELDRKLAISYAVNHANPEDIVLIAGKGHESYQEINHVRYPFSDAAVVSAVFDSYSADIKNVVGGH
jgi:UDP-N-acetylmuramoyl-L-alanyl-D-glutamate--2,6-diaminopimelate ligase